MREDDDVCDVHEDDEVCVYLSNTSPDVCM